MPICGAICLSVYRRRTSELRWQNFLMTRVPRWSAGRSELDVRHASFPDVCESSLKVRVQILCRNPSVLIPATCASGSLPVPQETPGRETSV